MIKDTWYHFTVEYYRMMGSKNIQIRYLKDGVEIAVPSTITGGFQQDKSFYLEREFRFRIGEDRDLDDPLPPQNPLGPSIGFIKNVTMFTHTSVIEDCPIGCKLCTKDLKCFFMDPLIPTKYLMGDVVVDECPYGYARHNQVCQPTEKKIYITYENAVSVRCLDAGFNEGSEWVPDPTLG
jgi:hypothetical protein